MYRSLLIQVRACDLLFFDSIVVHTVNEHMVLTHWNFLNISIFVVFAFVFFFSFSILFNLISHHQNQFIQAVVVALWFVNERNFCSVRRFIYFIHWFVCVSCWIWKQTLNWSRCVDFDPFRFCTLKQLEEKLFRQFYRRLEHY